MKKVLLSFVLSTLCTSAFCGIAVFKKGGGANGFYTVSESHQGNDHTLVCTDPGNSPCKFEVRPTGSLGALLAGIELLVVDNISNGIYSGTGTYHSATYSWSGEDLYNYDFTID